MGLRKLWVFECNAPRCGSYLELGLDRERSARLEARQRGWRQGGYSREDGLLWFCGMHSWMAPLTYAFRGDDRKHAEFCDRSRHSYGFCTCRTTPATGDPAMHVAYDRASGTIRRIHTIVPAGEIL